MGGERVAWWLNGSLRLLGPWRELASGRGVQNLCRPGRGPHWQSPIPPPPLARARTPPLLHAVLHQLPLRTCPTHPPAPPPPAAAAHLLHVPRREDAHGVAHHVVDRVGAAAVVEHGERVPQTQVPHLHLHWPATARLLLRAALGRRRTRQAGGEVRELLTEGVTAVCTWRCWAAELRDCEAYEGVCGRMTGRDAVGPRTLRSTAKRNVAAVPYAHSSPPRQRCALTL